MTFKDIRGHDRIITILRQGFTTGRFSHAYLFVGPEGIGKRLTALAMANIMLCSSGGSEPCGICSACIQVDRGNHPDLFVLEPEKNIITIDKIRAMRRDLSRKSFAGGYKVCLVDDAETMNVQAQNALLKTLEEPTPNTVIFLISSRSYRLLPTIHSRCQTLRFQPLPVATATELVMEKADVAEPAASLLSTLTGGSPGQALQLDGEDVMGLRESWIRYLRSAAEASFQDISDLATEISRNRDSLQLKLNFLRLWFRDMLHYKIFNNARTVLNTDKTGEIAGQASLWSVEKLVSTIFTIEEYSQALEHNVNPQLTMETLLLTITAEGRPSFRDSNGAGGIEKCS
ncbi:MAG: DNA polymerase III subunit delta' [Deltaproteobacteria bacterium]|nr:DNA polymerase III subunit delta' [Deltaproteobacteria bacterium]